MKNIHKINFIIYYVDRVIHTFKNFNFYFILKEINKNLYSHQSKVKIKKKLSRILILLRL